MTADSASRNLITIFGRHYNNYYRLTPCTYNVYQQTKDEIGKEDGSKTHFCRYKSISGGQNSEEIHQYLLILNDMSRYEMHSFKQKNILLC